MPTIDFRMDTNSPVRNGDAATSTGGPVPVVYTRPAPDVLDGGPSNEPTDSRYRAEPWDSRPLPLSSADTNLASGAAAILYYSAPGPNKHHNFYGFGYGYSNTPTNGGFGIQSPSGTYVFGPVQITAGGPGSFDFEEGLKTPAGQDVLVVLLNSAAGVGARLSLKGRNIQ